MSDTQPRPGASTPRKLIDGSLIFLVCLGIAAGIGVYVLKGPDDFWRILGHESLFSAALLPKIAFGVIIATALPFLLSRERISRAVGPDSGLKGLAIATLAGAVFPGGPSVIFPLSLGLLAAGADLGACVALSSSWMLIGLNRTLIWELSFLPADMVALRVALSLPLPFLIGWTVRRLWPGVRA